MLASLSFLTPMTVTVTAAIGTLLLVGFAVLRWLGGPPAAVSRRWSLLCVRGAAVATLIVILLNPSDVSQTPGPIDRPDVFYLLDSSQSMAVGDQETRFNHALRMMREANAAVGDELHAQIKLFRFGHRLVAVDEDRGLNLGIHGGPGSSTPGAGGAPAAMSQAAIAAETLPRADSKSKKKVTPLAPTDSDTQLLTALRQASSRFGRRPPAGLVLFTDGRTRDEVGVEQLAAQFANLKVPVHVAPVGDNARGGDVAIVASVIPSRARRFSEVEVQVFLRSYGYEGRRCQVSLTSPGANPGDADQTLSAPVPVTLHDGFQSVGLSFRTEAKTRKVRINVSQMPDEVSTLNNVFTAEVQIDRTKIRVLYIEGSTQPLQPIQRGDKYEVRGPYSDLQQALTEDDDIECVTLHAPYGRGRLARVAEGGAVTTARGFPETVAELSAFDAIILSDVGADSFTEQQLQWLQTWIGQRGGGLMMVGGQRSFGAGRWDDSPLAEVLPVNMRSENDWLPGTQVSVQPEPQALTHPLWTIVADDQENRNILDKFPSFFGANRWAGVKPNLTRTLAMSNLTAAEPPLSAAKPADKTAVKSPSYFETLQKNLTGKKGTGPKATSPGAEEKKSTSASPALAAAANQPAIVVGQFGRGRTMAMAMPITSPWANDFLSKWGQGDSKYYGKFWRNAIYWLTESSSIGRRRLVVTADKKFYRPGETITLTAAAFDEAANQTGSYRITSMIEPQTSLSDLESNYSPILWPDDKPRESGETGPFIAWGEEFDLPRVDTAAGKPGFALQLPIADALTVGSASQSLRVELTAMEEYTQVDSTSIDIQILHDPFEQQNPFPNHELLASIASHSGGQVISQPEQLAEVLRKVPMKAGVPIIKKTPLWSNWYLWSWLLGLLSLEWILRRMTGLA
ncbi:MAG: hypothetical protein JSS49_22280 [Planctomycetes bacterium]|nr:hypothetical protein [Planctomycetota bacterium]